MRISNTPKRAADPGKARAAMLEYDRRVHAEQRFFSGCQDLYALPPIFCFFSYKYIRPQL